ncbi:hypothetical protein HPB48_017597 [Haemaphysalis longicornis]|uniref:HSF-type DNA-binding domain-containing protein n=1 Tax=Haemaphysalis longicornis TaxID=44386 RepID=A0A9J6GLA5_HAELO|nr:hypothetical protein HPB48_017597 [Haemaphysalis longicornis]
MDPSEATELFSSRKFQHWRFPKKLWRIVNECKSGAITWSKDGTAVVINYSKFQSDYLDERRGVFKTNCLASFARQLNLYGFRMVASRFRRTADFVGNDDLHVFRHEFFLRDRPDMLSKVVRKPGRWYKNRDGGEPSSSSGGSRRCQGLVDNARAGHSRGHGTSRRQRKIR